MKIKKKKNIWSCKIGEVDSAWVPDDFPMRMAVEEAYKRITGRESDFLFSGWGASLTENERIVIDEMRTISHARRPRN